MHDLIPEFILFGTPLSKLLVYINGLFAAVIVLRLLTFERQGCRHKRWAAWLAWLVIVVEFSIPARLIFGHVIIMDWTEIVLNGVLAGALVAVKGNVVHLFRIA